MPGRRQYWPARCSCPKARYSDEAAAELAAAGRAADAGVPLRTYKCPGSRSWHIASRGFSRAALKTENRVIAWIISQNGGISYAGLYRELGLRPGRDEDLSAKKRARRIVHGFSELGLVTRDEPARGTYVTAADRAGLLRVMQVGLTEYAAASAGITMDSSGRVPHQAGI